MDLLRSSYQTSMRFHADDPPGGYPVRWYFTEPGTPLNPYRHVFGSRNWSPARNIAYFLGEIVGGPRPWRNGSNPVPEEEPPSCTTEWEWANGSITPSEPMIGFDCCGGWTGYARLGFRAGMGLRLGFRGASVVAGAAASLGFRAGMGLRLGFYGSSVVSGSAALFGVRGFATATFASLRLGFRSTSVVTTSTRLGMRASGLPTTIDNACCTGVKRNLKLRFSNPTPPGCSGVASLVIDLTYQSSGADAGSWTGSGTPSGSTGGALNAKFSCTGSGVTGWRCSLTGCTTSGAANIPDSFFSTCSPFRILIRNVLIQGPCCGGAGMPTFDLEIKDV